MIIKPLSLLLFILTLIFVGNTFAQLPQTPGQLPNIIPPTPDAAALGKYGQTPINKAAGTPEINVPLYEIKTARFNLPISLSYDASGIKVDQIASWVGLGWSLNAGGVITRTVVGAPDEKYSNGYLNTGIPLPQQLTFAGDANSYEEKAIREDLNTQPDYFFYNFNNQSGKLVFGEDGKAILIPSKPFKVIVPAFGTATTFQIIDDKGDSYFFERTELISTHTEADVAPGPTSTAISSWYLTKMVSADLSDIIIFNYTTDPVVAYDRNNFYSQQFGIFSSPSSCYPCATMKSEQSESYSSVVRNYSPVHLSSIIYNGGKVEFSLKSNRDDTGTGSLNKIKVYGYDYNSQAYSLIKNFSLNTGYFTTSLSATAKRLKLLGVTETDVNTVTGKAWTFDYNSPEVPPLHSNGQDVWGYYNGKHTNTSLLKRQDIYDSSYGLYIIGSADRKVYPAYVQAGMLTGIHYPTKGYTKFTYASNAYEDAQSQQATLLAIGFGDGGPGGTQHTQSTIFTPSNIRNARLLIDISKFNNMGVNTRPRVQIKKVSTGEVVYSRDGDPNNDIFITVGINLQPNVQYELFAEAWDNAAVHAYIRLTYDYFTGAIISQPGGGIRVETIEDFDSNDALITTKKYKYGENESGNGQIIASPLALTDNVEEFTHRTGRHPEDCIMGVDNPLCSFCDDTRKVYSSSNMYDLSSFNGSQVCYRTVTEYSVKSTDNIGKIVSNYDLMSDQTLPVSGSLNGGILLIPYPWMSGQLNYEANYKKVGSLYSLVSDKKLSYTTINGPSGRGLYIRHKGTYSGCGFFSFYDYVYYDYPIPSGVKLPSKVIETIYQDDGISFVNQKTTEYYYENLSHLNCTKLVTKNSKQEIIEQKMNYPGDMGDNDPTGIYGSMVTANILSPVVESMQSKNGSAISKVKINYYLVGPSIEPQSVEQQYSNNTPLTKFNYKYSNDGNLINIVANSGTNTRTIIIV
ncbi:MAG: hypothetical protein EOP47_19455, partial [Sphingobacteriaceae bacterium]